MDLRNRVVILTGASQGIGKAAAYEFAKAGCQLVLVARTGQLLDNLVADIGPGQAISVQADVSNLADHDIIVRQALDAFQRIDILVNNAGVGIYASHDDLKWSDLQSVMAINFTGAAHLIQGCIPTMRAQGGGLIINVSSLAGRRGTPNAGAYSASKAALEYLTESWRVELAHAHVRFSTLYPGPVETGFKRNALGSIQQKSSPVRRVAADQVARKLVEVARQEPRDAYVRNRDRMLILLNRLFPSLVDRMLGRHYATDKK